MKSAVPIASSGLLILYGTIHLLGFAEAFGLAELPQLTQPISRPLGALWLAAGWALIASAFTPARWLCLMGGIAVALDQLAAAPRPPFCRAPYPVPAAFDQLVLQCLAKDPGARPADMQTIALRLGGITFAEPWSAAHADAWWREHVEGRAPSAPFRSAVHALAPSMRPRRPTRRRARSVWQRPGLPSGARERYRHGGNLCTLGAR